VVLARTRYSAGLATIHWLAATTTLDGGPGDDELDGGPGSDTFVFAGNWGHDSVVEQKGGENTLDFTRVTEPMTHIFSGRQEGNEITGALFGGVLYSGTGDNPFTYSFPVPSSPQLSPIRLPTATSRLAPRTRPTP
jgi:Ca2+-binding RTX toxin-like protein